MDLNVSQLIEEIEEKSKDLSAFMEARDIIRKRVVEVVDSQSQLTPLPSWSGTDAVLGSLDLAIHSMERTVSELNVLLSKIQKSGPNLTIIHGGMDG